MIQAHWGGYDPQNSLSQIKKLMDQGMDGVEVDVYLTKEGIPVLFHGGDFGEVKRNMPELGIDENTKIHSLELSQVKQIDIGYGESPPTVEEVIQEIKGWIFVNFDLKGPDPFVANQLAKLID